MRKHTLAISFMLLFLLIPFVYAEPSIMEPELRYSAQIEVFVYNESAVIDNAIENGYAVRTQVSLANPPVYNFYNVEGEDYPNHSNGEVVSKFESSDKWIALNNLDGTFALNKDDDRYNLNIGTSSDGSSNGIGVRPHVQIETATVKNEINEELLALEFIQTPLGFSFSEGEVAPIPFAEGDEVGTPPISYFEDDTTLLAIGLLLVLIVVAIYFWRK